MGIGAWLKIAPAGGGPAGAFAKGGDSEEHPGGVLSRLDCYLTIVFPARQCELSQNNSDFFHYMRRVIRQRVPGCHSHPSVSIPAHPF